MRMNNIGHFLAYSIIIVTLGLMVGCGEEEFPNNPHSPPIINSFEASSTEVATDSKVALVVSATDPDGDDLTYAYQSSAGMITGTGNMVTWIAPATAGYYIIIVDVSNGELNAQDVVRITVVQRQMILVPAGEFQMGSNDGRDDEKPVHTVYVDAFYMDVYEVTNAQYQKFVEATGHWPPTHWYDPKFNAPEQPVVRMGWDDAVAYAEWAGKRLPTEAEWEYAARGGLIGKKYPWGDEAFDAGGIHRANHGFDGNDPGDDAVDGYGYTAPVGSFAPNGYGLYDMAGNVWEWCADWYGSDYYSSSPADNPTGPSSGTERVFRGGSWSYHPGLLRVAFRGYAEPHSRYSDYGFRCVSSVRIEIAP